MIVLTPTEATTLRAVLERVAAEGDEDSATAVAVLDNGELLLGIGRSWELGGRRGVRGYHRRRGRGVS
jgi:hypothetical protein